MYMNSDSLKNPVFLRNMTQLISQISFELYYKVIFFNSNFLEIIILTKNIFY